jgi:adenosylhomocysteinase
MDGFEVMPMEQAAPLGDIFISATGDMHVIDAHHMAKMKDGAMVAKSGHFDVEINVTGLQEMAVGEPRLVRPFVKQFKLKNGHAINLLGDGRLINLAAAEGHPASVMDMSFAIQALCAEYVKTNNGGLTHDVHVLPAEVDQEVARIKLDAMGVQIDTLTDAQFEYLNQWQDGT